MKDMASIRNMRFLLSGRTLGPFGVGVAATGWLSDAGSTFFVDVFCGDNLISLAVATGEQGQASRS